MCIRDRLSSLQGWAAGETGNEAGELDLQFYTGSQDGDNFLIDPASFVEGTTDPLIRFQGSTVTDGLLSTPSSDFSVSIPVLENLPISFTLKQAKLEGDVTVDTTGFALGRGVLGGYLTREGILDLVNNLLTACMADEAPDFCPQLLGIAGDPDTALALITGAAGGFDTCLLYTSDAADE